MPRTYFINARIIPADGSVIENGLLVLDGCPSEGKLEIKDKIEYVGSADGFSESPSPDDKTLDMTGYTLLPGLFDVNVRLDDNGDDDTCGIDELGIPYRTLVSYRHCAEALNAGVTTLKSGGMPDEIDLALSNVMNKFMFAGPTVISSGPEYIPIGGKERGVYGKKACNGAYDFLAAARFVNSHGSQSMRMGVTGDPVERMDSQPEKQMKDDEIDALLWLASSSNKRLTARADGDAEIRSLVEKGISGIERSAGFSAKTARLMAEKGVWYTPCLSEGTDLEARLADVAEAHKAGVRILCGTYILPSEPMDGTAAIIRELELLCEAGLSPMEAIITATSGAAEACGMSKSCGELAAGKKGDIIAVKGEPDKDISCLRNLALVVKNGRTVWTDLPDFKAVKFHIAPILFTVDGGKTHDWNRVGS